MLSNDLLHVGSVSHKINPPKTHRHGKKTRKGGAHKLYYCIVTLGSLFCLNFGNQAMWQHSLSKIVVYKARSLERRALSTKSCILFVSYKQIVQKTVTVRIHSYSCCKVFSSGSSYFSLVWTWYIPSSELLFKGDRSSQSYKAVVRKEN